MVSRKSHSSDYQSQINQSFSHTHTSLLQWVLFGFLVGLRLFLGFVMYIRQRTSGRHITTKHVVEHDTDEEVEMDGPLEDEWEKAFELSSMYV
jgi:hypothetical protein